MFFDSTSTSADKDASVTNTSFFLYFLQQICIYKAVTYDQALWKTFIKLKTRVTRWTISDIFQSYNTENWSNYNTENWSYYNKVLIVLLISFLISKMMTPRPFPRRRGFASATNPLSKRKLHNWVLLFVFCVKESVHLKVLTNNDYRTKFKAM